MRPWQISFYSGFHLSVEKYLALYFYVTQIGFKKLAHFFVQSEVKPSPSTTRPHRFSRASSPLRLFTSSSDWFTGWIVNFVSPNGNFGWIVNGRSNFVSPNGNFLGKTGFFGTFHLLVFTGFRSFDLDRFWSYLSGKSRGNGTSSTASPWKFPFGIWRVPFITTVDQPVFQSRW